MDIDARVRLLVDPRPWVSEAGRRDPFQTHGGAAARAALLGRPVGIVVHDARGGQCSAALSGDRFSVLPQKWGREVELVDTTVLRVQGSRAPSHRS